MIGPMVNAPTGDRAAIVPRVHTSTLYAGAALLALVIVGTVALALAGWDSQRIAGMWATAAGGAAVFLPLLNRVLNVNEAQTQTLAEIAHNTNGVLTDKIATGARAEIQAAIPAIADAVTEKIRAAWDEPIGYEPTPPAPSSSGVTWIDGETGRVSSNGDGLTPDERAALARRRDPLDEVA